MYSRHDVTFLDQFLKVLSNEVTFESYYFECPPINAKTLDEKNFEFVLVESDTLHNRRPDPDAFAEHFNHHCSTTVGLILYGNLFKPFYYHYQRLR